LIPFGILVLGICLGFGIWDFEFGVLGAAVLMAHHKSQKFIAQRSLIR
jgi:phosphoribosylformylglycinamidine (FGAM) synthase-like amidotransferase family enzyme